MQRGVLEGCCSLLGPDDLLCGGFGGDFVLSFDGFLPFEVVV